MLASLGFYWRVAPIKCFLLLASVTASNVLEGIGLGMLIPIIENIQGKNVPDSRFSRLVLDVYDQLSISWNLESVLVGMCLVFISKGTAALLIRKFIASETARLQYSLRSELLVTLLASRLDYLQRQRIGDHLSIFTVEANRAATALFMSIQWLSTLLSMVAYLFVAVAISSLLALIAIALAFIAFHPLTYVSRAAVRYGQAVTVINEDINQRIIEAFQAIKLIKSAGMKDRFLQQIDKVNQKNRFVYAKLVENSNAIQIYGQTIGAVFLAVLLVVASRQGLAIAEQGVFLFAFLRLLPSLQQLHGYHNDINANKAGLSRVLQACQEAEKASERQCGVPTERFSEGIRFQNVTVAHEKVNVLHNVSLAIRKGETVALVGPSGAGKTTLVDAALGLLRLREGEILIDGVNLSEISLQSWRRLVAYVPQDVFLFNDTIRNNLTWGDKSITDKQLMEVLRIAKASTFVTAMERGLDSPIGDRGVRLSGGQRQRIAIARALLSSPEILILDEATSALDHENEHAIALMIKELKSAMKMTILVIAHRPSTVMMADYAFVLRDGHIVEQGRVAELRRQSYSYLCSM